MLDRIQMDHNFSSLLQHALGWMESILFLEKYPKERILLMLCTKLDLKVENLRKSQKQLIVDKFEKQINRKFVYLLMNLFICFSYVNYFFSLNNKGYQSEIIYKQVKSKSKMKKCFLCFKFLRNKVVQKRRRPWLQLIQQHCQKKITTLGWCQIILENYNIISEYQQAKNELIREMRQTNISSQVLKIINNDLKGDKIQASDDRDRRQNRDGQKIHNEAHSPFAFCIDLFTSYIQLKYGQVINPSKFTLSKVQNQFHDFVQVMKKSMIQYYDLQGRQLIGEDFYNVSLGNYIIDKIFKSHGDGEEFNNVVVKIVRDSEKQKNDRINFNIQKFKNIGIQEYGVSPIFQLNENTLKHLSLQGVSSLQKPYSIPIQLVKDIVKSKSPQDKLKNMHTIVLQIESCIHKFFKNQVKDPNIRQENVHLDAQNALSILVYVIVQSGQSSLLPHLNLTKQFLNPNLKKSNLYFCIQNFQLCLENIQKGNVNLKRQELMEPGYGKYGRYSFDYGNQYQDNLTTEEDPHNLAKPKRNGANERSFFQQTSNLEL